MKTAFSVWEQRIAPVFDTARQIHLVESDGTRITAEKAHAISGEDLPQKVAAADVRKSINFCHEVGVTVLGVIENMSGFACPKCGEVTPILRAGGGRIMADEMHVPFLGSIPIDPLIAESGDEGKAFVESAASSPAAGAFREIVRELTVP